MGWRAEIFALPESMEPGSRFLEGVVQSIGKEAGETRWSLRVSPVPNPNPPQDLVESSRSVGGYPGILRRLMETWPEGSSRLLDMETEVTFLVDERHWHSPFGPKKRKALPPLVHGPYRAELAREVFSWKMEPAKPVREVIDLGYVDEGVLGVKCSGRDELQLETLLFVHLEQARWEFITGFLEERAPRSRRKT